MNFSSSNGYSLLSATNRQSYIKWKVALSISAGIVISLIGWHHFSPGILQSTDVSRPAHLAPHPITDVTEDNSQILPQPTTDVVEDKSQILPHPTTDVAEDDSQILPHDWTLSDKAPQGWDASWKKPADLKVVGLVFYGRRATVSILECYLSRNLITNGGVLDEVVFLARTQDEADLVWLDDMVKRDPLFTRRNVTTYDQEFGSAYDLCEDDVMYIKIDDDIVFVEDSAIPTLVHTRLTHPEYYVVSANIMNQPSLSWIHHHLGVVKPYFPELKQYAREDGASAEHRAPEQFSRVDWRASSLPAWSGPADFSATDWDPDHSPHRWLPLKSSLHDDPASYFTALERTPIKETSYSAWGAGLLHWQLAAQEHYSFLEHLENNELWRYKFHTWDYHYERMGIQFIAMMGRDINMAKPIAKDDEGYFSEIMTAKLKRHAVVEGRGLAAHYSFGPQREGLAKTDVLDRYRDFAERHICTHRRDR